MDTEDFYPGSPSVLEPEYGEMFTGYRIPASQIGAPTKQDTANQIQQVSALLNQGIVPIEVGALQPEIFDQIPKQHLKEINRMAKLTGAELSVHAPLIEASGFTKEGWNENNRIVAERQLKEVIKKSHALDPQGNIPVTVHSSNLPGREYIKGPDGKLVETQIVAINQETGQLVPIKREEKFYPETGREELSARKELDVANNSEWINSLTNLAFYKKHADEIISHAQTSNTEEEMYLGQLQKADLFLDNVESSFRTFYNKAYKYGGKETKKELKKISEDWKAKIGLLSKGGLSHMDVTLIRSHLIDDTLIRLEKLQDRLQREKKGPPVQFYKPIEEFAMEKTAKTVGETAFYGYDKYGSSAPIVSLENLYPGMAFSRASELKQLVKKSREEFVEKAMKKGKSRSEAEEAAKKLIGVTWDVGHLNMMRKQGFKEEDLAKESEKIAKYVKHVHLTDNFGYSDSHLPPGMGNVPIKKIMKKLGISGEKAKKIVEAGGFAQHFGASPFPYALEGVGSSMYTNQSKPAWTQYMGFQGGYFSGYGKILPEQSFSMYGSGFSTLPAELGGQIPGKQSRMSGTPME